MCQSHRALDPGDIREPHIVDLHHHRRQTSKLRDDPPNEDQIRITSNIDNRPLPVERHRPWWKFW